MTDMPTIAERDRILVAAGLRVVGLVPTLRNRWIALTLAERPAS
jgi:hypothetical protein